MPSPSYLGFRQAVTLIILAVALAITSLTWYQLDSPIWQLPARRNLDPIARRAIDRTKSLQCKRELTAFVEKQTKGLSDHDNLRSSCISNQNDRLPEQLGCLQEIPAGAELVINNQATYSDNTTSRDTCLQSCYSYGYEYAAHRSSDMSCYCAGTYLKSNLTPGHGRCKRSDQLLLFRVHNVSHSQLNEPAKVDKKKSVRLAFLLTLNGRSILQVRRLLRLIYSSRHLYYLHVDGRQHYLFNQLLQLENQTTNIFLTKRRLNTIWGGSSLLHVMLMAMQELSARPWDYILNLSESDLPLKSLTMLEEYLSSHSLSTIYLKAHNMTGIRFIKKQGLDQAFYQCDDHMWRLGPRQLPTNIVYSGGSDWFVLPRHFCDFITSERHNINELVAPLIDIFNKTLLPAESFFHTLALNSRFCDQLIDNNLRMTNWHRKKKDCGCQHNEVVDWCGCSPRIYRWADVKRLNQTKSLPWLFFSRKFDPSVSSSVIAAVETYLVRNLSSQKLDTRYWLNIWHSSEDKTKHLATRQFGLFARRQAQQGHSVQPEASLESIDLYFNQDKFIGLLVKYCKSRTDCVQLLVERNTTAHLMNYNADCFKHDKSMRLIEVNHNFDIGERIFRNHLPLCSESKIVVYHEWLVRNQLSVGPETNKVNKVRFHWVDPSGRTRLIQNIKLRSRPNEAHLYLAHRLNISGHFETGVWCLSVFNEQTKCLDYQFPIFSQSSYAQDLITQEEFDHFYTVTKTCTSAQDDCNSSEWSLEARDDKLRSYDLNYL